MPHDDRDEKASPHGDTREPAGASIRAEGQIGAFLDNALEQRIEIAALAAEWRMTRILLRCRGEARRLKDPKLVGKIRGGWGNALEEVASPEAIAERSCSWETPCALSIFFTSYGRHLPGFDLPKPYVFAVDVDRGDLLVMLTLFGAAESWAGEATDGLVRALRVGLDRRGPNGRPIREPIGISDRSVRASLGVPVPDLTGGAVLEFPDQVSQKKGSMPHFEPATLLKGLVKRIKGLALWHGADLAEGTEELLDEAHAIGATAQWIDRGERRRRQGSRLQARSYPVVGRRGVLILPPMSPVMATLIALGEYTYVGASTRLGNGSYRLHPHAG
ncbi:hypothetical protein LNKW23_45630 [Paralimibaculum aggregatum]|uniref:CRISPR-associated protein Cas6 C-terminal domain-containing protein n=1 Tax=Paralimibaculum aggregatum TaxID=3036245 RepID=A0ABQ6LTB6_9RHOB|nr:hypothetical protein [Limibaculum sp. NKW23]GMG85343.1 hypothetical protein LNKW23_45630 [Limibaculum sp. NKW23]